MRIRLKMAVRQCPGSQIGVLKHAATQPASEQMSGFMSEHHHAPRSDQPSDQPKPTHAVPR